MASSKTIIPSKEAVVLELLKINPSFKVSEIADALNVSKRTVSTLIASLVSKGLINRVGGKKAGHWEIKQS